MSGHELEVQDMYDVIVVGARCAGASTAMLLARKGHRVLLVDRNTFPSDMALSNHLIWPPGIAALERWGLLDKLVRSGCPAMTRPVSTWSLRPDRPDPTGRRRRRGVRAPTQGPRRHFGGGRDQVGSRAVGRLHGR